MVKYTESQSKIVATGHTVVSFAFVLLFVGSIVWCVLKALSFAAPAIVPVATGFFLALFFKPYYRWWEKKVRIRSVALILMLLTVLVPVGLLLWLAGSAIIDEIVNLIKQIPVMLGHMFGWLDQTFPKLKDVLAQLQQVCEKVGGVCVSAGADAVSSGANLVVGNGSSVTNAVSSVVCETGNALNAVSTNAGESMAQVADATFQSVSNSLAGTTACNIQAAHSATGGVATSGISISYDQLAELYAKYGDSIKNAGMNIYHATAGKVEAVGAGGGATAVTTGSGALGASYDKLAAAFASCKGAFMVAGASFVGLVRWIIYILVTVIFFVYFLMSKNFRGGQIAEYIPMLKDKTRGFVAGQIDAFIEILVSFFQRQVAICLVEGCYYGIGFWLVGLPYGFFIGFLLGVLNLIPLFGSVVCLPFALTVAYFGAGGSVSRIALVLLVWAAGLVLDGYFITPKIQGDKTGLGYAGVIFSFLFWSILLGPMMGMLLAIPLSAFCVVVWRSFCDITKSTKVI